jgi:hypothetical protein
MSASEIVEQVRALPPDVQREVFNSIRELEQKVKPQLSIEERRVLSRQLMGAGRKYLKPGDDPIGDLIREREADALLDEQDLA